MKTENLKILAIDDNPDNLITLKAVIGDAFPQAKVITAQDGHTGVELAFGEDPDVILLDIIMPGMDGYEVCRALKENPRLVHIPVVFLTALKTDRQSRIKALEAGGEAFLTKPFEEEELIAQIRSMAKIKEMNVLLRREKEDLANLVAEQTREIKQELAERRKAEDALKKSEANLHALIENTDDILVSRDHEGRAVVFNSGFAQIVKLFFGVEAFPGIRTTDYLDETRKAHWNGLIAPVMAGNPYRGEYTWTVVDKEMVFEMSLNPIRVGDEIIGVTEFTHDITRRKRMEKALQQSEASLRAIFSAMKDVIAILDAQGRYIEIAPTDPALLYKPAGEMLGKTVREIFPDAQADIFLEHIQRSLKTHNNEEIEYGLTIGGKTIDFQATITPLSPDTVMLVARDITDRKRAEAEKEILHDQLLQAQKMESVGRLAGGVAHDFNNYLGIIIGHAENALKRISPDQEAGQNLEQILTTAGRSAELVRQLLAFARKQTISPRVLDLNATITSMLGMLRRLIGENIEMVWSPDPDLWPVRFDPSQVDQILANLLVNARDAISGFGKITIQTRNIVLDEETCSKQHILTPGEYVLLEVSDNGKGIDQALMPHIFEPFFTTKEVGKGTGLGLATVFGIVKQNNGYIIVTSKSGKGTTFKIYLPRVEAEISPCSTPGDFEKPQGRSEVVLLVEDEAALLELGKDALEDLGYIVLTANTAGDAVRLARENAGKIDLLITDVVMPGMNGRMLADHIRSIQPGLITLYMSGYTADIIADHGVLPEGVYFIQKPFLLKELAEKVQRALNP
jgi:PAS domain S-box-containing protein